MNGIGSITQGSNSGTYNTKKIVEDVNPTQTKIANKNGNGWVFVSGFGQLTNADLLKYVNNGAITETQVPDKNGNISVYYTARR